MRLIFGIGNPGVRYKNNRHNVGFMFLDFLADKYSLKFKPSKQDYYFAEHKIGENHFSLIKPSTYVNNSGIAAVQALSHFTSAIDDLLIVHDEVYLPLGTIRIKLSGGDGGHNGVGSIIYHTSSEDFARLRVGVGTPDESNKTLVDYVLADFNNDEIKSLNITFTNASFLTEAFITGGNKRMLDANSKQFNKLDNSSE